MTNKKIVILVSVAAMVLAAIILPPVVSRYKERALQREAKANLKSIYKSEQAYFSRNGFYADKFNELNWAPEKNINYSYYLSLRERYAGDAAPVPLPDQIKPFVEKDKFKIAAVANIDTDSFLDVWIINEKGKLKNIQDDVLNKCKDVEK